MIYRCFNYSTAPSLKSRQQRLNRRNHTSYWFMMYQMVMMCEALAASPAASQATTRASSEGEFPYSQGQDSTCQFEQALKHGWTVPPWEEPPDRFCARPPQVRGSGQDKVVPKMVRASPKLHWRADRFFSESLPHIPAPLTTFIEPAASEHEVQVLDPSVMICMLAKAETQTSSKGARHIVFDTEGKAVGIDNRASVSMSPDKQDFFGHLKK